MKNNLDTILNNKEITFKDLLKKHVDKEINLKYFDDCGTIKIYDKNNPEKNLVEGCKGEIIETFFNMFGIEEDG